MWPESTRGESPLPSASRRRCEATGLPPSEETSVAKPLRRMKSLINAGSDSRNKGGTYTPVLREPDRCAKAPVLHLDFRCVPGFASRKHFNHVKRKIDPRRNASRRHDRRGYLNKAFALDNCCAWGNLLQLLKGTVVRGRPGVFQDARPGQQESARTDREQPLDLRRLAPDPCDEAFVLQERPRPVPAQDDEDVGLQTVVDRVLGADREPAPSLVAGKDPRCIRRNMPVGSSRLRR
jgi:hypothetical protein